MFKDYTDEIMNEILGGAGGDGCRHRHYDE